MKNPHLGRQVDEERRRISARLHWSITQSLAALTANLDLIAANGLALPPARRGLLDETRMLARDCFQQVRTLADELHPPLVAEVGLRDALAALIAEVSERTRVSVVYEPQDWPQMPEDVEMAMYRIVEDCLSGLSPAVAAQALVTLRSNRRTVELAVVPATLDAGIRWRGYLGERFAGRITARVARRERSLAFVVTVPRTIANRR